MAQILSENNFDARPLLGGFDAWREAGGPVEPK